MSEGTFTIDITAQGATQPRLVRGFSSLVTVTFYLRTNRHISPDQCSIWNATRSQQWTASHPLALEVYRSGLWWPSAHVSALAPPVSSFDAIDGLRHEENNCMRVRDIFTDEVVLQAWDAGAAERLAVRESAVAEKTVVDADIAYRNTPPESTGFVIEYRKAGVWYETADRHGGAANNIAIAGFLHKHYTAFSGIAHHYRVTGHEGAVVWTSETAHISDEQPDLRAELKTLIHREALKLLRAAMQDE